MCVICIRQPSYEPTNDEQVAQWLNNCMIQNPDGAGIAWPTPKGGQFIKGLDDYEDMLTAFKDAPKDVPVVVHFRIGTQGLRDKYNTHPFVIAGSGRDAEKLSGVGSCLMVHNGIIDQMPMDKVKSDTRILAERLRDLPKKITTPDKINFVRDFVGGGKYAFISKSGVKYMGKFYKPTETEDWLFSNQSYLDPLPVRKQFALHEAGMQNYNQRPANWYRQWWDESQQQLPSEECLFCEWYGTKDQALAWVCHKHAAQLNGHDHIPLGYDPYGDTCSICQIIEEWDTGNMLETDIEDLCQWHQQVLMVEDALLS